MSILCKECGKEIEEINSAGTWIYRWGCCSDECLNSFRERRRHQQAELRVEPLMRMPDELSVSDFETFALKVAVYAVFNLDAAPQNMRDPDILALKVKELLLLQFPGEYVHIWEEGSGWTRRFRYSFNKTVPREVVLKAMCRAGFAWNVAW